MKLLLSFAAMVFPVLASVAWAEPHVPEQTHPKEVEEDWACSLDTELARSAVFEELQLANGRLFLNLHEVLAAYKSPNYGQGMSPLPNFIIDGNAKRVESALWSHFSVTHSLNIFTGKDDDALTSSGYASASLPGAALILFPVFSNNGYGGTTLLTHPRLSMKITARSIIAAGAAEVLSVSVGDRISQKMLKNAATEVSLKDQMDLQRSLFDQMDHKARDLAEILRWDAAQKDKFKKAVRAEVFKKMKKQISTFDIHNSIVYQEPVVKGTELGEIDLISILKNERLATPPQITGLMELQRIHDLVQKVLASGTDPNAVDQALLQSSGEQRARKNIQDLSRMIKLLKKLEYEPDSLLRSRIEKMRWDLESSFGQIRELCNSSRSERR